MTLPVAGKRLRAAIRRLAFRGCGDGPEPDTLATYGLGAFVRRADAGTPRALAALVEMLGHREPFFRFEAAAVLGDVGTPDVLPALRTLTADAAMPRAKSRSTAWSVGENARRAIAKIEARR